VEFDTFQVLCRVFFHVCLAQSTSFFSKKYVLGGVQTGELDNLNV